MNYKIISKNFLAENVIEMVVHAPPVCRNANAGQFVILRADENGERVPFTICDMDKSQGTITLLIQTIGATTHKLAKLNAGDYLADFAGPLGHPTDLSEYKKILLIGGGIGTAVIFPQAKALKAEGKAATVIVGARSKDLIMYEEQFKNNSEKLYIMTDDGSYGEKGFVTDCARKLLSTHNAQRITHNVGENINNELSSTPPSTLHPPLYQYDCVFAVGPLPMMRAVCNLTKEFGVKTIISMNSTMVDGTGMCGGCRLTVGGKTKFACVDGPEFDGHLVDFDEAMTRSRMYAETEKEHLCKLGNNANLKLKLLK